MKKPKKNTSNLKKYKSVVRASKKKKTNFSRLMPRPAAQTPKNIEVKDRGSEKPARWFDIDCPDNFDLHKNREVCRIFFSHLREQLQSGKRIRLCFSKIKNISSDSLLHLLGQVHKYQVIYGRDKFNGAYPQDEGFEHLLLDTGFFSILGVEPRTRVKNKRSGRKCLKFKSDNIVDGGAVKAIRNELFNDGFEMAPIIKRAVFRVISEAMNNADEHAYIDHPDIPDSIKKRWWFGASVDFDNNLFTMDFYDVGVGIPKTVEKGYRSEEMQQYLAFSDKMSQMDDASIIVSAIKEGRSRTGKTERGKGLMDMHKLIDVAQAGCLRICSNRGWYSYDGLTTSGNTIGSIEGTLIHWEIPLDRATALEAVELDV